MKERRTTHNEVCLLFRHTVISRVDFSFVSFSVGGFLGCWDHLLIRSLDDDFQSCAVMESRFQHGAHANTIAMRPTALFGRLVSER
jgi:hypothetical protein